MWYKYSTMSNTVLVLLMWFRAINLSVFIETEISFELAYVITGLHIINFIDICKVVDSLH